MKTQLSKTQTIFPKINDTQSQSTKNFEGQINQKNRKQNGNEQYLLNKTKKWFQEIDKLLTQDGNTENISRIRIRGTFSIQFNQNQYGPQFIEIENQFFELKNKIQQKIMDIYSELQKLQQKNEDERNSLEREKQEKQIQILQLQNELNEKIKLNKDLQEYIQQQENKIKEFQLELNEKIKLNKDLQEQTQQQENKIKEIQLELNEKIKLNKDPQEYKQQQENKIKEIQLELNEKIKLNKDLQEQTQQQENKIKEIQLELNEKIKLNKDLQEQTQKQENKINEIYQSQISPLQNSQNFQNRTIESLVYSIDQVNKQYDICEFLDEIQQLYYMGFVNILQPNVQIWEVLQQLQTLIVLKLLGNTLNKQKNIGEEEKLCLKCEQQLEMKQDIIELRCHKYHEKCFIELVEQQIEYRYPQLSCICECNMINPANFLKLRDQQKGLQLSKKFQNIFDEQPN